MSFSATLRALQAGPIIEGFYKHPPYDLNLHMLGVPYIFVLSRIAEYGVRLDNSAASSEVPCFGGEC